jgi:23S rRNA (cytosine1962-C5)-methyltransferase
MTPRIDLLFSNNWSDYDLIDSGAGQKLERFGPYTFVRPEVQAMWRKALPSGRWAEADAFFLPSGEESGGHWDFRKKVNEKWEMSYHLEGGLSLSTDQYTCASTGPDGSGEGVGKLKFVVMTTPGRHLGVFPECAANWDWMTEKIRQKTKVQNHGVNVLNLFGYTGLATLAASAAGARVTHVDASKKSIGWARENQVLSGLNEKPIRWILDDALKFVEREGRRGVKYDGILLDPPKFGRGPKGEIWEVFKSLPDILNACKVVLSDNPLFLVLTVYAVKLPAIHAYNALAETMEGLGGNLECGELVTREKSAGRLLSQAVFARWEADT